MKTLLYMMMLSSLVSASPMARGINVPELDARVTVLPNGLTIIIREDRSAPVASVQAWNPSGSIHEAEWLGAGLSHILEHMLFKGTEKRTTADIVGEIQREGGYVNAYTSFDRTVYYIDVPKEGVATALDVLADAMMNSTLPEDEYVKEQEVIRREFAMGMDSPERVGQKLLFATAYQQHPYREPVIGHLDIYNRLTRNDVLNYYKKRYVPNNLFFVVVGDVDADAVEKQLREYFEKYPRQAVEPVLWPGEPLQTGRRTQHQEFPTEVSRLMMAWHIPSLTHPNVPALDLLSNILGSGRSSRMYEQIRDRKGLAHSISAFSYTPGETGLFGVSAMCDPDKRDRVEAEVLEIISEVAKGGVTEEELEKARRQLLHSHLESLTSMSGQASDLGSSWLLVRDLNFTKTYLDAVQRVTTEDVRRVAAEYLKDTSLSVTSLNPPGTLQKQEKVTDKQGEYPISKFEGPNGLPVLVREDPRLPLISLQMVFRGGVLAETAKTNGISQLLSSMLLKGTTTRSTSDIANRIESVGGSITSSSGRNSFSVAIECLEPDLELAMELLADVVLNPSFPQEALDVEKNTHVAAIKAKQDQIMAVAGDVMREALFSGHPYALDPLGTVATVKSFGREDLNTFHRKQVAADAAVLAVFGSVKQDTVAALVKKHFGSLAARSEADKAGPPTPLADSTETTKLMEKNQAVMLVGYQSVALDNPDRYALELVSEAGSDMGSRFFRRIREELGLAYYVGSQMTAGPVPGSFVFYVGTDPAKIDQVKSVLLKEIQQLATDGLTEKELLTARKKMVGQALIGLQSNSTYAQLASLDELYGLGYDHVQKMPKLIDQVSLEDIRRACAKYFLNQPYVQALVSPPVAAGDEKTDN